MWAVCTAGSLLGQTGPLCGMVMPLPAVPATPDSPPCSALPPVSCPCCSGVVLVHQEPPEARKPTARWRLYVFKNGQPFGDPLHIHRCCLGWQQRRSGTWSSLHAVVSDRACGRSHHLLRLSPTWMQDEQLPVWPGAAGCRRAYRPPFLQQAARGAAV